MADNDYIFNKHDTPRVTEDERMRGRIDEIDSGMESVSNCRETVIAERGEDDSMVAELEDLFMALKKEQDEIYARLGS